VEAGVIAYKFLDDGACAPFTGFRWPVDEWVEVPVVQPCRTGLHACRVRDLPYWLGRELWRVELAGEVVAERTKVVAARARLRERIDEWDDGARDELAADVLHRTRERFGSIPVVSGYVVDIEWFRATRRVGLAAMAAARAAERSGGPRAYERERARQAGWLARRLRLG
jgi:hypothetical protein